MKILKANPANLKRAVTVLQQSGVIAHPADTCFGLAVDLMNRQAVQRVQAIKGREGGKPMSIMLPSMAMLELEKYARLNGFTRDICNELLPGPVTILLPKGPKIPKWYFPETDLIGIRVPYDIFTQDLLNAFREPLVTTSANRSGCPLCHTHQGVIECFKNQKEKPDLVFEGLLLDGSLASTVILPEKGKIRITRLGAMKSKELERILGIKVTN